MSLNQAQNYKYIRGALTIWESNLDSNGWPKQKLCLSWHNVTVYILSAFRFQHASLEFRARNKILFSSSLTLPTEIYISLSYWMSPGPTVFRIWLRLLVIDGKAYSLGKHLKCSELVRCAKLVGLIETGVQFIMISILWTHWNNFPDRMHSQMASYAVARFWNDDDDDDKTETIKL